MGNLINKIGTAAAAPVIVALMLVPDAHAYRFHLHADARVHFEEYWFALDQAESKMRNLGEELTMNFSSYLIDPLLLDYDLGFQVHNQDLSVGDDSRDILNLGYSVRSTLLPRSDTPLTLRARRITSDYDYETYPSYYQVTSSLYGLNWNLFVKNLPQLRVNLDHSDIQSDNPFRQRDEQQTRALIDVYKRAGAFNIRGVFEFEDRRDLSTDVEYRRKRFRFEDVNSLSKTASLFLDAQALNSETGASGGATTLQDDYTLNARLHHQPSTAFLSNYRYSFSESSRNNGTDTFSHLGAAEARYRFASHLETVEHFSFTFIEHRAPEGITRTVTEQGLAGLHYRRPLSRLYLDSGYEFIIGGSQVDWGDDGIFYTNRAHAQLIGPGIVGIQPSISLFYFSTRDSSSAGNDLDTARAELRLEGASRRNLRLFGILRYEDTWESNGRETLESRNLTASLNSYIRLTKFGEIRISSGYNRGDTEPAWSYLYYYQGDVNLNLITRILIVNSLRQEWEKIEGSGINTRTLFDSRMSYRLAKLFFSVNYYYLREEKGISENERHSVFAEIRRGFDWYRDR